MKKLVLSLMVLFAVTANVLALNVKDSGVKGDGKTDDTAAVQAVLDSGATEVYFPDGTYLLSSLKIPGDMTIRFAPKAKYKINPVNLPHDPKKPKEKRLIILSGDNITLDGFNFDFTGPDGKEIGEKEVRTLIYGEGVSNLRVLNLRALKKSHYGKVNGPDAHPWKKEGMVAAPGGGWMIVVQLMNCKDVELARCNISYVGYLLGAEFCENVSVHENRAEWTNHISTFGLGCKQLRHYANWSRNVVFQCVWWGGDPNDRHSWVPNGSANVVHPDLKPGDKGYHVDTVGVYDISVQNNYAEYGTTLAWGAKARNVIMSGNIARYMADMAYDSEGDENVVIANNISINSRVAGIGCYFWCDKVQITGNLIMTLDEGEDFYKGNFVRLHSGRDILDPNHFGTGKAIVSGNLFISEVPNIYDFDAGGELGNFSKTRSLQIESCRDVTISGNKFVNGSIVAFPLNRNSSRVVILNNVFEDQMDGNSSGIKLVSNVGEGVIRGNVFRKTGKEEAKSTPEDAAIYVKANERTSRYTIENNMIDGWKQSISCKAVDTSKNPVKCIVRNNTVSGNISLVGEKGSFKQHVNGNLNMDSLKMVEAKQVQEKNKTAQIEEKKGD